MTGNHTITRQIQLVGFAEGLIDFTGRFGEGSDEEAVQIVNLKVRTLHSNAFSSASALTRDIRRGGIWLAEAVLLLLCVRTGRVAGGGAQGAHRRSGGRQ